MAWPDTGDVKFSVTLSGIFVVLFYLVYGGTSLLTQNSSAAMVPHLALELRIPFVPAMAVPYLSVPLVLGLAPFLLRERREVMALFFTLSTETLAGGIVFALIPLRTAYPLPSATGFFGALFDLADTLNLTHNSVPSLHVAFAVTAAVVLSRGRALWVRLLILPWLTSVAASTLMLHQHHLLDLITGLLLGCATMWSVYRFTSRRDVFDAIAIEILCLREFGWFCRRGRRYVLLCAVIYWFCLPRWRETRVVRAGYCLLQHLDDVLDGDRQVGTDQESYVLGVVRTLETGARHTNGGIETLAAFVGHEMLGFEDGRDDPKSDFTNLIDTLLVDRRRMDEGLLLDATALSEHHRRTFHYSLNLTFILTRSAIRAADVPELSAALSWCSPVRDLKEDLSRGLVNLPREVVERARREGTGSLDCESLMATSAVTAWLQRQFADTSRDLELLRERVQTIDEPRGRAIVSAFLHALSSFRNRYERGNRSLLSPQSIELPS